MKDKPPTAADGPGPRPARAVPFARIRADHMELLAAKLGGHVGATRVVVLARLTLDAYKRGSDTAALSRHEIAYITGLHVRTVEQALADLCRFGLAEKHSGRRADGGQDANLYRVHNLPTPSPSSGEPPLPVCSKPSQRTLLQETQKSPPEIEEKIPPTPVGGDAAAEPLAREFLKALETSSGVKPRPADLARWARAVAALIRQGVAADKAGEVLRWYGLHATESYMPSVRPGNLVDRWPDLLRAHQRGKPGLISGRF